MEQSIAPQEKEETAFWDVRNKSLINLLWRNPITLDMICGT